MTTRAITWKSAAGRLAVGLFLTICLITLFSGCDRQTPTKPDPLQLGTKTLEFNLQQRMTQTVPGVMGRISLKLGDIESAKGVEDLEVIDHKDESTVASARVMRKGAVLDFEIDSTPYVIQLVEYDAARILHDNATFTLRLDR